VSADLSVIVTAHGEGLNLHATLRNVKVAIRHAQARGIVSEVILVVDTPTKATAHYIQDAGTRLLSDVSHTIVRVKNGDPGLSRMSGAHVATGRYVALVDGDNLFNESWLTESVEFLRTKTTHYVAHPAFVVTFGARASVRIVKSMDSPRFGYSDLLNENPWDTAAVLERSLLLGHPYREFPVDSHLGPEDWVWNIETVLAGARHAPVPNTVMFYRAKGVESSVNERRQVQGAILPPLDILGLAAILGPGQRLLGRQRHRRSRQFLSRIYQSLRPMRRALTRRLPRLANWLYLLARRLYVFVVGISIDELVTSERQLSRANMSFLARERAALGHFEPTLAFLPPVPQLPIWKVDFPDYAELLVDALAAMGPDVSHVVAVPWLGTGGADLISQSYAQGWAEIIGDANGVVMLVERGPVLRNSGLDPRLKTVTLSDEVHDLPEYLRVRLVSEVIMQCSPQRLHIVNAPATYGAVKTFARAISGSTTFTAQAFCADQNDDGMPSGYLLHGSADYLPNLAAVYCDNRRVAEDLSEIAGFSPQIFDVHYQPIHVGDPVASLDGTRDASNSESAESASVKFVSRNRDIASPLRVLWAGRLDRQKNLDTLIEISQEVTRRKLPIEVHVHGSLVLDARSAKITQLLGRVAIYHGPFEGGLSVISGRYDAFLMTSLWEGLPLTLLEATAKGLPLVVPKVGGITEFVENGVSGLVVDDPQDVDAYIERLLRLQKDVGLRDALVEAARARAKKQHSWNGFVAALVKSEKALATKSRQRGMAPSKT
jgi:glycosyltransferase involved in cell wall biosynthesis